MGGGGGGGALSWFSMVFSKLAKFGKTEIAFFSRPGRCWEKLAFFSHGPWQIWGIS